MHTKFEVVSSDIDLLMRISIQRVGCGIHSLLPREDVF